MTDEHIQMYIEEFLSDNNLQDTNKLTMQDLIGLANRFINFRNTVTVNVYDTLT